MALDVPSKQRLIDGGTAAEQAQRAVSRLHHVHRFQVLFHRTPISSTAGYSCLLDRHIDGHRGKREEKSVYAYRFADRITNHVHLFFRLGKIPSEIFIIRQGTVIIAPKDMKDAGPLRTNHLSVNFGTVKKRLSFIKVATAKMN
jgi:hypothetical protein